MKKYDLVRVTEGNQVTTDSLLVAKKFKKPHYDVLKAIRNLPGFIKG